MAGHSIAAFRAHTHTSGASDTDVKSHCGDGVLEEMEISTLAHQIWHRNTGDIWGLEVRGIGSGGAGSKM